ncbi:MAG: YqeG family HAD IIIA-type phosphatase [Tumebacillaceae bacterium]
MFLEKFIPSLHLHSVFDIELDQLKARGIRGIITNLDNTLVESNSPNATDKLIRWLKDLHQHDLKVVIVSNNRKVRVSEFARPLGIPFVYEARKPWGHPFERALRLLHTTSRETVVVGDQLLTDIYGGNRFGFYTVWVDPISPTEGIFTKINRFFERRIYSYLKKRGYMPWDDHQ